MPSKTRHSSDLFYHAHLFSRVDLPILATHCYRQFGAIEVVIAVGIC